MRIKQLPPAIANQIAAGEVIERPASVVKELLENALDAGASEIIIEVSYGGLLQIKVSDNGSGILAEDLPLAVSAHATSKISTLNDLYAIGSMGFRGEALASIASVAKLIISSRPVGQEDGMMLSMTGVDFTLQPCARAIGTTVEVLDLFYNAPVRKRFLKGEKVEFQAIDALIRRFALSVPGIGITLKHNKKNIVTLPPALNERAQEVRRAKIMGAAFMKESVYVDVQRSSMSLRGWVSGPNLQRSQSDKQWIYVNNRMVKDKLLQHALKQAYDEMLHPGRFPVCLLYFSIATAEVDVNVHPTKHELRFQQPRLVHDFLCSEIRNALQIPVFKQVESVTDYVFSRPMEFGVFEPSPEVIEQFEQKNSIENDSSWIVLNKQFVLIRILQKMVLVDVFTTYRHWLLNQINNETLPLKSRPLLVPIRISLAAANETKQIQLAELGIQLEQTEADQFLVRTIPIAIPYLDLHQLFNEIFKHNSLNQGDFIHLLVNSQRFDAEILSQQERYELKEYIAGMLNRCDTEQRFFRELSVEGCRMLMHA